MESVQETQFEEIKNARVKDAQYASWKWLVHTLDDHAKLLFYMMLTIDSLFNKQNFKKALKFQYYIVKNGYPSSRN